MAKYSKEELREIGRIVKENAEQTAKMEKSVSGYLQGIKAIGQEQARIKHLKDQEIKLAEQINTLTEQRKTLIDEEHGLTGAALTTAIARRNALEGQLTATQALAAATATNLVTAQATLATQTQIANQANGMTLAYNQMGQVWNNLPGLAEKFYGWVKGFEALEMSKEIKKAELSMGILSNQSKFFGKNMMNASQSTQQLGVSVSDLAIAQRGYADEIGRGLIMSEDELQAMAEIGKGTMLGMDGAVGMAAAMENFGLSVEASRDGIQETVDIAHKMGVNANSAIKELGKTLKLAQKYHFKGGVKGMASMASYAALIKMDMEGVANMADKAFRPEGAVEMAARLATMGGDMAKLGDPFVLMFKARNDFEGFAKDMGDATAEFAQFNKKTGEFDITGLQLDRIKEIGEITGVGAENMAEMAKQSAKFNMLKGQVNFKVEDEDREMIAHMANFDKDSGEWMVTFDGKKQLLSDMKAADMATYRREQKSLKDRAEQSQTFDQSFDNLLMQFKTIALPFIEALNTGLVQPMIQFQEQMKGSEFLDNVRDLGESIGKFIGAVGGFVLEFPKLSLAIAAGGTIFFNAGKWFANGQMLGMGFNTVTGGGGGMMPNGATGVGKGMASKLGMGKNMAKNLKGGGAIGGGVLSAGLSGYNEWTTNADAGMSDGENVGRTVARSAGAGLGAWGGAAAGAAIGSVVPVVGTVIGGIIGGILGGLGGDFIGDKVGDVGANIMNDGIIKFNPQDKFLQMNDGLVASTDKGKIDDIVKTSKDGGSTSGKIEFGKLKIEGKIQVDIPNGDNMNIDLAKDPFFIREITKLIQEQLRIDIGGGKLNPNPM